MKDPRDLNQIGGSALEAIPRGGDQELTSTADWATAPKYPSTGPWMYYFAAGALSLDAEHGKFVLANGKPEAGPGVLKGDQNSSALYATPAKTTLGSTDIDTIEGDILNPAGTKIPSSHMTPQRTWLKNLLPTLSVRDISLIAISALVQAELRVNTSSSKPEPRKRNFDVADIVKRKKAELLGR